MNETRNIEHQLIKYYSEKIVAHGPSPKGVDYASYAAQQVSFDQLSKLFLNNNIVETNFSLLDFGCGYGAFLDYLNNYKIKCNYTGYDLFDEMINQARILHKSNDAKWVSELPNDSVFDYVIASGIFSIKLDFTTIEWESHVLNTLIKMNELSKKGFAFNSLTSYSDTHLMKDYLYYPDPCFLFDFCKQNFSKYVSLIHDYPKYEFTIIVRKSS